MWFSLKNLENELTNIVKISANIVNNLSDIYSNKNLFSVFYCNICSVTLHINELLVYLNTTSHKFDIIVLTETWLSVDLNICIDGYTNLILLEH